MYRTVTLLGFILLVGACRPGPAVISPDILPPVLDPALVSTGRDIFRFDAFGNEAFWTDTLRLHEVIQTALTPKLALELGLQVDVDALPPAVQAALSSGTIDLNDPTTTVTLLKLHAVVGVVGHVERIGNRDTLTQVGITCALCHSMVDNSLAPGIGHRRDGWANVKLNPGGIIATSPALTPAQRSVYSSWGVGRYDPRFSIDGKNTPIVIPPAYGLARVSHETFTGDGPVSYWNAYVAVTQMHGRGNFSDPRLGITRVASPDLVTPKLAALRAYQFSLGTPVPPSGSFEAIAASRGRQLFIGKAKCSSCHLGVALTDINLGIRHPAAEVGTDPSYALRTAEKRYRTTPLRGLWQHPPYFHDGSAATLDDVVTHYQRQLSLRLSVAERADLVQYLRSL